MTDRIDAGYHGRHLGTATGWDGEPAECVVFYDFHPAEDIPFDFGYDLNIDDDGWIYTTDRDGNDGTKFDLPTFLAAIPRIKP